ncbi:MAG: alpha/beta hydrolase [Eubacteriales bacterium]|nr:alpha/beta hydrolase [Eubacteriales bacterium]
MSDTDFSTWMNETVCPYITLRRTENYFRTKDGLRLRYRIFRAENPSGSGMRKKRVMIFHGFSEFLEKYDEAVWHFLREGMDVYMLELRGHGYSDREVQNKDLVHVDSFDQYTEDLHAFLKEVMEPEAGERNSETILFAHSMGGGIGAVYADRYPDDFDKVLLSSPMIRMRTGSVPGWLVPLLAWFGCARGKEKDFAIGQGPFPGEGNPSPMSRKVRFFYEKRLENPKFQMWSASYGWIRAALENSKKAARVSGLTVPMLLLAAGQDKMVYPDNIREYAKRQQNARFVFFPEGHHELFNDNEEISDRFWKEVFSFIRA